MSPKASKPQKRARGAGKHAGGRPPKQAEDRLSTQLGVRCDPDTAARLELLVEKFSALGVSRAAIARRALAVGLGLLEQEPTRLLGDDFDEP